MRVVLDPPLPDAFIIFENVETGRLYCAKTDSEGRASLYLPVGTYNLKVFKEGYKPYSTTVTVDKDLALTITLEEIKEGVTLEVSGADPKDPKWMPPDGWTYIFSMEKIENAHAFAFGDKDLLGTATHQIRASNVEGKEGFVSVLLGGELGRAVTTVYATRVAIAFRIPYVDVEGLAGELCMAIDVFAMDGSVFLDGRVLTDGSNIYLEDGLSGAGVSIPYTTDWMVFVFDFNARKAYLYTPAGELLAEVSLTEAPAQATNYTVYIGGKYVTVDVDWVAIKSTIPIV